MVVYAVGATSELIRNSGFIWQVGCCMNDMNMRANPSRWYPRRTHRFYAEEPVYHFGHGLSYTGCLQLDLPRPRESGPHTGCCCCLSYTGYTYKLLSAQNRLSLLRFMKSGAGKRELYQTDARVEYIIHPYQWAIVLYLKLAGWIQNNARIFCFDYLSLCCYVYNYFFWGTNV